MDAEAVRQGAYLCVSPLVHASGALAALPVQALASRLELDDEFTARDGHPREAIAYLGCVEATQGQVPDEGLSAAGAILHVASNHGTRVTAFCEEFTRLVAGIAHVRILRGAVQPTRYTGAAMHDFAYARQLPQRDGHAMPNAFLLPLLKTADWWAKDWMERHTYLLPRYDANGKMVAEGHALAASAGIPVLMRRTYFRLKAEATSDSAEATDDSADATGRRTGYDFLTYFECADADVAAFHAVCGALRDVRRNPEWEFVREGPLWRGRRMPDWPALWTPIA